MPTMRLAVALANACALALISTATAVPAAEAKPKLDRAERAMLRSVNGLRTARGLPRLAVSGPLARAARGHTGDMLARNFFDHGSSDGTPFGQRVWRHTRARKIGENLGWHSEPDTPRVARAIVAAWMRSPHHRRILLTRGFRRIGIASERGTLFGAQATVFTADFASRR